MRILFINVLTKNSCIKISHMIYSGSCEIIQICILLDSYTIKKLSTIFKMLVYYWFVMINLTLTFLCVVTCNFIFI